MTEENIKEMLNGIINNGEKWECRCLKQECCSDCDYSCVKNKIWQSYKLGNAIHDDWEYRKVETWLEKTFPLGLIVGDLHMEGEKERKGATEVCKKILEKVRSIGNRLDSIVFKDIEDIIKDLGVKID